MGVIQVALHGSFGAREKMFFADSHGHAAAVAEAIAWLSSDLLPETIVQDHKLQAEGDFPKDRFGLES